MMLFESLVLFPFLLAQHSDRSIISNYFCEPIILRGTEIDSIALEHFVEIQCPSNLTFDSPR